MAGEVPRQGIPEAGAGGYAEQTTQTEHEDPPHPTYPALSQRDVEKLFEPQVLARARDTPTLAACANLRTSRRGCGMRGWKARCRIASMCAFCTAASSRPAAAVPTVSGAPIANM